MTPSISVVMAAYNAERTIGSAVRSILGQRDVRVELIVCDDCSTDGTRDVIRSFDDSRVRLLENTSNVGPGPSRDRAIALASTPWIAMVDADDAIEPERLSKLISAGETSDCQVVFDDTLLCHDTPGGMVAWKALHGPAGFGGRERSSGHVKIEDYVVSDRLLIHPVIRVDVIREHGIRHGTRRFAEDAEFYLRLAMAGARFCYFPRPLYRYRISPGSLTAQAKDPALMRKCMEECLQWDGWWPSARQALQCKIASLHRTESLYAFVRSVRSCKFWDAARIVMEKPGILSELPARLVKRTLYQLHRLFHKGHTR